MKKIIGIVCLTACAGMFVGCKSGAAGTAQDGRAEYAGEVSERVNFWPLWFYGSTANAWNFHTIAGLAGAGRDEDGYRCSWMFPLWYEDNTGLFSTPVYGQTADSHWVFPLWYWGEDAFVSLPYAQGGSDGRAWWATPLLLSWGASRADADGSSCEGSILLDVVGWNSRKGADADGGSWWLFPLVQHAWATPFADEPASATFVAGYLSGWGSQGDKLKSLYAFPLFYWDDDGSLLTLLGGRVNDEGTTNTVITPIVGIRSGQRTGGWLFPLWSHSKDADFDEKAALVDSPALPDCIKVAERANPVAQGEEDRKTRLEGEGFYKDNSTVFLLTSANRSVCSWNCGGYGAATNVYGLTERYGRDNLLLFDYASVREVTFDLKTKAKLSDTEGCEASSLLWLYRYEGLRDRLSGGAYARHRVLWRLWDWEGLDGDVSLDVFPFFSYDTRKDGYLKTSLLWRLFRYERDPEAGTSVDFLFVPVWR